MIKTSSWNINDKIGLSLFILLLINIILILYISISYWKSNKLDKKIIYTTILLWISFILYIYSDPIRILHMISSLFSLSISTPEFLDRSIMFPNHKYFEKKKSFKIIKQEVNNMLEHTNKGKDLVLTKDTYGGNNIYIGSDVKKTNDDIRGWRILNIKAGNNYSPYAKHFPHLCKLLKKIPEVISCVISVLEPHIHIPMHVGYYKGIMRYMIPTHVPKDKENVFLCVNGIKYHWTEGVGVLWDDSFEHTVYNNTDEIRIVIYMDVLRPLTGIAHELNKYIINFSTNSTTVKDEIKRTEVQIKL